MKSQFANIHLNEINFYEIPPQWSQRSLSPHGVRTKCSDRRRARSRSVAALRTSVSIRSVQPTLARGHVSATGSERTRGAAREGLQLAAVTSPPWLLSAHTARIEGLLRGPGGTRRGEEGRGARAARVVVVDRREGRRALRQGPARDLSPPQQAEMDTVFCLSRNT